MIFSSIIGRLQPFRPIYLPVDPDEPSEQFTHHKRPQATFSRFDRATRWASWIIAPVLTLLIGLLVGSRWLSIDHRCMMSEEGYVPFLHNKPSAFHVHDTHFDARLHHPTEYGAKPSPHVDKLWSDLAVDWRTVYVSEDEGIKAGLQGSVLINHTRDDGSSRFEYFATVDVFHQLHCLDLLRKALKPNFAYYQAKGEPMFIDNDLYELQTHLGHCVDIVRQSLTCKPDYSLLGYVYVEGLQYPVPNFPGITHKCRDLASLQDWVRENAVSQLKLEDFIDRKDKRVVIVPKIP